MALNKKALEMADNFRLVSAIIKTAEDNALYPSDYQVCETIVKLRRLDKAMAREMVNYCNIPNYDGSKKEELIKKQVFTLIDSFIGCEYEWTDNLYSPLALKLKDFSNFVDNLTHI